MANPDKVTMFQQITVGIIGGMSWESSAGYYRLINQYVAQHLGGLHSADILLHSLDFAQVGQWQHEQNWDALTQHLIYSAQKLEQAGATAIAIATNTMHKVAPDVQNAINIPLLHIAGATAAACHEQHASTVALLGTRFTMEAPFYRTILERAGLTVLMPALPQREAIHQIIYEELCQGIIRDESRQVYQSSISQLQQQGAQAIILGCTEIGLLIKPDDTDVTLLDTTQIHARQIASHLLGQSC